MEGGHVGGCRRLSRGAGPQALRNPCTTETIWEGVPSLSVKQVLCEHLLYAGRDKLMSWVYSPCVGLLSELCGSVTAWGERQQCRVHLLLAVVPWTWAHRLQVFGVHLEACWLTWTMFLVPTFS